MRKLPSLSSHDRLSLLPCRRLNHLCLRGSPHPERNMNKPTDFLGYQTSREHPFSGTLGCREFEHLAEAILWHLLDVGNSCHTLIQPESFDEWHGKHIHPRCMEGIEEGWTAKEEDFHCFWTSPFVERVSSTHYRLTRLFWTRLSPAQQAVHSQPKTQPE